MTVYFNIYNDYLNTDIISTFKCHSLNLWSIIVEFVEITFLIPVYLVIIILL